MKTEVELKRRFLTGEIKQKSKSGLFSASDLVKIANQRRAELGKSPFNLSSHLGQKGTTEFIEELQTQFPEERIIVKSRGRNGRTWVHPLLFIDIALAVDPKFKVQVYQWLYDELLKYRNDSGSSYNKMVGALYKRQDNVREFSKYISRVANFIKKKCEVEDWNKATEEQLKLRDKMHNNIALLCGLMRNTDSAIRIGVSKALEDI